MGASYKEANAPVAEAWEKASQQTEAAFAHLAPQIQVTNVYGPNGLVDPDEIAEALRVYRQEMFRANYLRALKGPGYNFAAAAATAKQELKAQLIKACQKQTPRQSGPVL
jgi:hypothetical protein